MTLDVVPHSHADSQPPQSPDQDDVGANGDTETAQQGMGPTPQTATQTVDGAGTAAQPSFQDNLTFAASSQSAPASSGAGWLAGKSGVLIGLAVGLVLGVGVLPRVLGSGPTVEEPEEVVAASPTTVTGQAVTVAVVGQQQVRRTLEATGTVVATDLLPILAKSTGLQVQQVLVDEGDRVSAGQVLARLDQSVVNAQIAGAEADLQAAEARVTQQRAAKTQAQARLAEAQANLERYSNLASEGAVSQEELDTRATTAATVSEDVRVADANINSALADVRSAEARVQQLRTQLSQAVVTAPASGIVAERFARVGDVTSGSEALFTIIRDRQLELDVDVPETQLPQIAVGSTVAIRSDVDPQLQLQGQVKDIAPLIDPQTRDATVTVTLPSSPQLRPGMFLQASFTTDVVQGLTVPADALLPQPDGSTIVYRVGDDNQAQAQTVEVGDLIGAPGTDPVVGNLAMDNAEIEILSGLGVGDRVVVEGAGYLKDGDPINIVDL